MRAVTTSPATGFRQYEHLYLSVEDVLRVSDGSSRRDVSFTRGKYRQELSAVDFLNQRWCEYTGLSREDAFGWQWQTAISPDDLPAVLEFWRSLLAAV